MKDFAALVDKIDQTTRTSVKTRALAAYFETAEDRDKLWTIALFTGRRPKRAVTTTLLRTWAAEQAGIAPWLFEECYPIVGDLAETIALVLPEGRGGATLSLSEWIDALRAQAPLDKTAKRAFVTAAWDTLEPATGQSEAGLAHKLMGDWTPDTTSFHALVEANDPQAALSRPYPFYLAHALDGAPADLGAPQDWQAEWKWDGIRAQLIVRGDTHFVWSRGEELMYRPARRSSCRRRCLSPHGMGWPASAPPRATGALKA